MAEVQHRHLTMDAARRPLRASNSTINEWQVSRVAVAPDAGPAVRDGSGREMTAVLDAWRSALRSLAMHLESGPERDRLMVQVTHLRAKYHCLFEAALDAHAYSARRRSD